MHFNHGVHEPFWDLKLLQNIENVGFLIDSLWMTDVPHMNNEILMTQRQNSTYARLTLIIYALFYLSIKDSVSTHGMCHILQRG